MAKVMDQAEIIKVTQLRLPGRVAIHLILLGFAVCLTLSVRAAFRPRYIEERRRIELAGRATRTLELLALWNSVPTIPLDGESIGQILLPTFEEASKNLSIVQKLALLQEVPRILKYLASPDIDNYWLLKTNGLIVFPETSAVHLAAGNRPGYAPDEIQLADSFPRSARADVQELPRVVGFAPGQIRVAAGKDGSPGAIFNGSAGMGFTAAVGSLESGIRYPDQNQARTNLYIYVGMLAKTSTSTNTAPVHFGLLWLDSGQRWVPYSLFADELLNFRTLF